MTIEGYRKLAVLLVILIVSVVIEIIKGDISGNIVTLLLGLYATYAAGNGIEHAANAYVEAKAPADPVPTVLAPTADPYTPKLDAIAADLEILKNNGNALKNAVSITNQAVSQSLSHTDAIIKHVGI